MKKIGPLVSFIVGLCLHGCVHQSIAQRSDDPLMSMYLKRAENLIRLGEDDLAKPILERLIAQTSDPEISRIAVERLQQLREKKQIPKDTPSQVSRDNSVPITSFSAWKKQYDAANSENARREIVIAFHEELKKNASIATLLQLETTDYHPLVQQAVLYEIARLNLATGNYELAQEKAKRYLRVFSTGIFSAACTEIVQQTKQTQISSSKTIALLLPLTGVYRTYGRRTLRSIELALGFLPTDFSSFEQENAVLIRQKENLSLVLLDIQNAAMQGESGVNKAKNEYHAQILIGALLPQSVSDTVLACQRHTIPCFILSSNGSIESKNAFRIAFPPAHQAVLMADLAVNKFGYKHFAILYPQYRYGTEMLSTIQTEIKRRKGIVVKAEGYEKDQTTYSTPIRKITGMDKLHVRPEWNTCVKSVKEQSLSVAATKKAIEKCEAQLLPIINFEALFILDFGTNLRYIIPALKSADILTSFDAPSIERYRRRTKQENAQPIRLFGPSAWNDNSGWAERVGQEIEGAVYVDGINWDENNHALQHLKSDFEDRTGERISGNEVYAYDTGMLVKSLLEQGYKSSEEIEVYLKSQAIWNGIGGTIDLKEGHNLVAQANWYRVDNGTPKRIDESTLFKERKE